MKILKGNGVEQLCNSRMMFAIKSFTAGMLALYTAFYLDLERPFWALISAYIVSQPLAGAVRSKAVYRIFGSFVGLTASIAFVPNFVNEPLLLSIILSLWVSVCLFFSVLDRTPRSYVLLLAGYTVSIIGFPSVSSPNNIFYVSLARFEEITLGIIFATIIHSIVFPLSVSAVFLQQLSMWWNNAKKLLQEMQLKQSRKFAFDWQNMAAEISQLYILSRHFDFDVDNLGNASVISALDERMVLLLAMLCVISNNSQDKKLSDSSQVITSEIKLFLVIEKNENQQLLPEIVANSSWQDILKWRNFFNVKKLKQIYDELIELQNYLFSSDKKVSLSVNSQSSLLIHRPLHKDYRSALFSAIASFVAIMSVCIFWIAVAWPEGSYAAQLAAIACCFFASQMNPGIFVVRFIIIVILTIPIAAFYAFAVLTRVDGFFMLMIVLAPYYLIAGFFMATPRFSGAGIAAILALANLVLLQDKYNFEFANFLNVSTALLIGMGSAAFFNYIFRSPKETKFIKYLLSSIKTDLVAISSGSDKQTNFIFRTEDRLGLFAPLLRHSSKKYSYLIEGFKSLSIGMDVINLEKAIIQLPSHITKAIRQILNKLASSLKANKISIELLQQIDFVLSDLTALSDTEARDYALLGLSGLRQDLFPDASPYQPSGDSI